MTPTNLQSTTGWVRTTVGKSFQGYKRGVCRNAHEDRDNNGLEALEQRNHRGRRASREDEETWVHGHSK